MWGTVSLIIGAIGIVAAICRNDVWARVGLIASATLTGLITVGLFLSTFASPVAGVMGVVVFAAVTVKDLIVCQDPIRSPFEALFREPRRGAT